MFPPIHAQAEHNVTPFSQSLGKGGTGISVKRIQEWLIYHRHGVAIDSDFGGATEHSVRKFQALNGLRSNGIVDEHTFQMFCLPLKNAFTSIDSTFNLDFAQLLVSYAKHHIRYHPVEIGGQNRGPWVRAYMKGNDGYKFAWCAGFISTLLAQTANTLGKDLQFDYTMRCDDLGNYAKNSGTFLDGTNPSINNVVRPGMIFLLRKTPIDWIHTGVVTSVESEVFATAEGNTNASGHRDGYEACFRTRAFSGKYDFIDIPALYNS